jgi:membrane associated rhomboid family serine protease
MLDDRDYMRERPGWRFSMPPVQAWSVILALNILVFLVQVIGGSRVIEATYAYGALSLEGLRHGYVWQLLTFQFLHGGLTHLVLNSIALYFCGRLLEPVLGLRSFLSLYFLSGFVGGLVQLGLALILPERFGGGVVGASGGICGLIAAFALLNPQATIYLFFVLPVRAFYFVPLVGGVTVLLILFGPRDGIAHGGHLGGLLVGVAWIKLNWHRSFEQLPGEDFWGGFRFWKPLKSRERKRQLVRAASVRSRPWRDAAAEPAAELPQEEFISKEVDPILEKISAHGIHSLTERERKILETAQKRMSKRK